MARESKARRDEKRFGRSEQLADQLFSRGVTVPEDVDEKAFLASVAGSTVISADNVAEYMDSFGHSKEWSLDDLHGLRMPFPKMFIEHHALKERLGMVGFDRIGVAMREYDAGPYLERMQSNWPSITKSVRENWDRILSECVKVNGIGVVASILGSGRIFYLCRAEMYINRLGGLVCPPVARIPGYFPEAPEGAETTIPYRSTMPAMLAICFMNCKNVSTQAVDPDRAANRERRKAGLKPFLRYHTINIEPMKRVLRDEGGIEANGLKVALHICRGHFKTWTDSYFGRPLEKPVTYWVPSHVKGSASEGVVVSDYNVKPPGGP